MDLLIEECLEHARTFWGRALSVPHSVSQSVWVIIIIMMYIFQELVACMVIPKDGFILTEEEIKVCLVKAGIEPFKFISGGVKFVKKFPKNSTGKIERNKLENLFLSL